jgi:radical SAM-linked protein
MSPTSDRHPYAAFLAQVQKPSRYTGGEYGERRIDLATARARVCLAFPDVYDIGMSHLGTKILYGLLNKADGIACERVFAPWLDMEKELRSRSLPLFTLETASPLGDFDVVGFSLQYELNFTGVLSILDLGGLPLRSAARVDAHPLILAGGPVATHPEPLAPFIDAFFIGEAEELLPALCLEVAELRRAKLPRLEILARLAGKYPLYVPALYATERDEATGFVVVGEPIRVGSRRALLGADHRGKEWKPSQGFHPSDVRVSKRTRRAWVKDLNRFPFPDDSPLPHAEAVFDRMAVEIARGCTEGCRFCQAGVIYRPVRERDPVAVIDALMGGIRKGGYDETSLASLSPADYSCVTPLVRRAMARLRDDKVSLSVSSLRAYGLDEELLGDLAAGGITGLTFSPEAGTQRMRDLINKNVTEDDILESAQRVFSRGHQRMKLYFMIGLPTETDEDVIGIVETAARVQAIGRRYLRAAKVSAAVSTFVPKPHTPFQWAAMDSRNETARKHRLLSEHARRLRVELRVHENTQSHLEAIFARGDRACAEVLERAFQLGCRFDGWSEAFRADLWEQSMAEERDAHGFDPERYLGAIPEAARLPWDHIDVGVEDEFLRKELYKAMKGKLSPPCGKPVGQLLHPASVSDAEAAAERKLVCYDCGVACDLDEMKHQRLFFLRRMNAWSPRAPLPSLRRSGQGGGRHNSPRPATDSKQNEPARFRLRYSKLGPAAFLAHLDLVRHLPRAFRRAGLEIYYSKGFHPKPSLAFGPALGLGIPSLGEFLDVKLVDRVTPDEILRRLRMVSPPGIDFLAAAALVDGDLPLGRVLTESHYAVRLPEGLSASAAEELWNAGEPLLATRRERSDSRRPDRGNTRDVRKSIVFAKAAGGEERQLLAEKLRWPVEESERVLFFGLVVSALGSARPVEVIEAFFGEGAPGGCEIVRMGLYATAEGEKVDPVAVEKLRAERFTAESAEGAEEERGRNEAPIG